MVGWNDYQSYGELRVFNVGLMSLTAITGLVLGYDWARQKDIEDMKKWNELYIDENEVS
jgi:hypothetical protein